ncbi:MAG TPA: hypothetical protein PKO41_07895 [Dokdonella sp.]|uniref:hypothetical protein n=1 Tax=Dokdonella sp. TaxID=2291710 RepID=UPI0025BC1C12|nr:hypothetical protein [Dokdonella sp.]MBX3693335.1 hypothetical protein [Dokdonella sp.]MCW5568027.1 hypothetical protein [Dokdonella sp.]HNR92332.1 hypothetical protein [Dokdonella sp.]
MNPVIELNLSLILLLPWYLVLGWLYWRVTARGRGARRSALALGVLAAAIAAATWAGAWAFAHADPAAAAIWKQVLASALGYGAFLGVLAIGFLVTRLKR